MVSCYVAKGYWNANGLVSTIKHTCLECSDKEALADNTGGRITWSGIDLVSDRIALGLIRLGLKKDDVLIAQLPSTVDNILLRVALLKAGVIGVFPAMTIRGEILKILQKLNASAFAGLRTDKYDTLHYVLAERSTVPRVKAIIGVGGAEIEGVIPLDSFTASRAFSAADASLLEGRPCGPFDVAFLALTSGTTGIPKFCEWPVPAIELYAQTVIERMRITADDTIGIIAALSGAPGLTMWLTAIPLGARTVLLDKFDAESALRLIERERVTVVGAVPTQLIKMINHPSLHRYDLSYLRAIRVGGAPIAADVAALAEKRLGCKIVRAAGTSESMTIGHTDIDDPDPIRLGTIGKPWKHNEVVIVDKDGRELPVNQEGEIRVRGPCTGSGYYNETLETETAWGCVGCEGWYRTGDLGRVDNDGNITIVGRIKNMILRGGQNIYPEEIEGILAFHPKVLEVAIVPVPDPEMQEKACAFVTLRDAADTFTFQEMVEFLESGKIARFKIPERLEVIETMPTVGDEAKIDRKALAFRARARGQ
jgi:non-ribosomal peptide synthetase component E (peptide arylation enzyme)